MQRLIYLFRQNINSESEDLNIFFLQPLSSNLETSQLNYRDKEFSSSKPFELSLQYLPW